MQAVFNLPVAAKNRQKCRRVRFLHRQTCDPVHHLHRLLPFYRPLTRDSQTLLQALPLLPNRQDLRRLQRPFLDSAVSFLQRCGYSIRRSRQSHFFRGKWPPRSLGRLAQRRIPLGCRFPILFGYPSPPEDNRHRYRLLARPNPADKTWHRQPRLFLRGG